MSLVSLNKPTITVNSMKVRIGHGHPYSVKIGFEPFQACGIVKEIKTEPEVPSTHIRKRRYPTFMVDRDILLESIEAWERFDLSKDSPVYQYFTRNCFDLRDSTNHEYWKIRHTLRTWTNMAIKILYLRERCQLSFENWINLFEDEMPTQDAVNTHRENIQHRLDTEPDNKNALEQSLHYCADYVGLNFINPKGSFREAAQRWFDFSATEYHPRNEGVCGLAEKGHGYSLGVPGVTDTEMFNDEGKGSLICL